tara:strand:- start:1144 stop:1842 length:699 start_codon:yes stop_codon:yes gene_type:complete
MTYVKIKNLKFSYPLFGLTKSEINFSKRVGGKISQKDTLKISVINDISIDAYPGDRIALCGNNGAGKSTLLKLLSGIYFPDEGSIDIKGTSVSMLDSYSGFEADATGVENIYLRGYLLGCSKHFIEKNLENIIEFSELGEFVNYPIKTYSAGMVARLSFSISNIINPDIYFVDETIGTGDENFQKKISNKFQEIISTQKILFLASHSRSLIETVCNKVYLFEDGKIKKIGLL